MAAWPDRKELRLAFVFYYFDLAKLPESSFGPLALPVVVTSPWLDRRNHPIELTGLVELGSETNSALRRFDRKKRSAPYAGSLYCSVVAPESAYGTRSEASDRIIIGRHACAGSCRRSDCTYE